MNNLLPKLNAASLLVIAASLALIAYRQGLARPAQPDQKVVYIDAASGKVFEREFGETRRTETTEEKLRKEFPGGTTY